MLQACSSINFYKEVVTYVSGIGALVLDSHLCGWGSIPGKIYSVLIVSLSKSLSLYLMCSDQHVKYQMPHGFPLTTSLLLHTHRNSSRKSSYWFCYCISRRSQNLDWFILSCGTTLLWCLVYEGIVSQLLTKSYCLFYFYRTSKLLRVFEHLTTTNCCICTAGSTGIMGGSPCPVEVMKQVIDKLNMTQACVSIYLYIGFV